MYALVSAKGSISFRLDYRMNGRRETVTFGKYGPADLSLARARELFIDARRAINEGRSPAIEKQRAKRRLMVRKSELQDATWDEVDFENAVWTISKERMKRSKAHNVYLSRQMLDIFIALKTGQVKVFTRRGNDWTKRFRKIASDASEVDAGSAILDVNCSKVGS
jgi:integrase